MLNRLYQKTKLWDIKTCLLVFYLISVLFVYMVHNTVSFYLGLDIETALIADKKLLIQSLFISPLIETLIVNSFLMRVFNYFKVRPENCIIGMAFVFCALHISNGWMHLLMIFVPGLLFSWNYVVNAKQRNELLAFFSTFLLHSLYNFTFIIPVPLINLLLNIY